MVSTLVWVQACAWYSAGWTLSSGDVKSKGHSGEERLGKLAVVKKKKKDPLSLVFNFCVCASGGDVGDRQSRK